MANRWGMASVAVALGLFGWAACGSARDLPPNQTLQTGSGGAGPVGPGPSGSGSGSGPSSGVGGLEEDAIVDPEGPCDDDIAVDSDDPFDAARAIGLCKQGDDRQWGILDARYTRADGSDPPGGAYPLGHGVLDGLGATIGPLEGKRLLALSSGTARDPSDSDWASPAGFDKGYLSDPPYGFPKESPACPGVLTGATYDDVALEVVLRPPESAEALAFDFNFLTYEWPDYVCSQFNDFFVTLLEPFPSGQSDGNISFDAAGNSVSVNNALVGVCDCNGGPPCSAPPGSALIDYACELGDGELDGTGFETRAGTSWLNTTAPIDAGGLVKLRFAIYDSGDGILDSTVVIDRFRWRGEAPDDPETKPVPQ